MNNMDILVENIPEPVWLVRAEQFINRVLEKLEIKDWDFSVTFCDNIYIQKLNSEYRGQNNATDVLTFALDDDSFPFVDKESLHNAGDIVISLQALSENAEYFGVEEDEELKRLLIHGILHLKGMDHSDNSPQQEMLLYQEEIMVELTEVKIFNR